MSRCEIDNSIIIRPAGCGDVPRMGQLYDMARASLHALGVDQWQDGYPYENTARLDSDAGRAAVAVRDGVIIATAAVYVGHEPTYDKLYGGEWALDSQSYGIIHRIAVAPEAKNTGVASMIMDYCAGLAVSAGLSCARCDTHEGNRPMRHTLEKNGYVLRGVIYLESGAPRVAYEKILKHMEERT